MNFSYNSAPLKAKSIIKQRAIFFLCVCVFSNKVLKIRNLRDLLIFIEHILPYARYGPVFGSISMLDLVLELDGSSLTTSIYDVQSPTTKG